MSNAEAWVAGILVAACIVALIIASSPKHHAERAAYLVVRGSTGQQAGATAAPGDWLLVHRVSRP